MPFEKHSPVKINKFLCSHAYDRTASPTIAIIPSTATIPVSKENLNPGPAHSATPSNITGQHPGSPNWTRTRSFIGIARVGPLWRIIGSNRGP